MPHGGANITPLALSPAPGILFPSGFDFHLPLGDMRGWYWAGSQEQPASLFSLHFALPGCRPGLRPPPPHPRAQVCSQAQHPLCPPWQLLCLLGRVWGRREKGCVPLAAPHVWRPARAAGSAASLPLRRPAGEALPRCARGPPGSAGDAAPPPSRLAPAEMSPGSAGLLSPPSLHFLAGFEASPPKAGQRSQPPGIGTVGTQDQRAPCLHPSAQSQHQHFQAGLPLVPCTHLGLTSQTSANTVY